MVYKVDGNPLKPLKQNILQFNILAKPSILISHTDRKDMSELLMVGNDFFKIELIKQK